MGLVLYNSLNRKKQAFTPLDPQRVTLYACGPTVYNFVHIGNARPAVAFDTLYRVLRSLYSNVVYARNITDIDDKIINASKDLGEEINVISNRYSEAYFKDMAALNTLQPDLAPYATQHIPEMIRMVETLIEKGHAYAADTEIADQKGHVLFAVQSMPDYGQLSGRSLEDMLAGARVEVASYKKYAGDFVLWKPSSDSEPGWYSPWGRGRPGWHLECSAMIKKHLGDTIDIHAGGQDLIFPHHENEIAQSCCANNGKALANYWLHNGFINIDGEKMSKSLGNFRLVNDLLQQYPGEVLRYVILSSHYRSEQNFSKDLLDSAWRSMDSLYGFIRGIDSVEPLLNRDGAGYQALLDDLNTPVAISELYRLTKEVNQVSGKEQQDKIAELMGLADILGLLQQDPEQWFTQGRGGDEISAQEIEALIQQRHEAKQNKDYAGADAIRQQLLDQGVVLEDSRDGTQWRRS
ncbi:MAG: cysteine--tRNA ligase [Porticoccaceae bacterium]|nr:cysteine--tRNA ligase [Porticoccaceae bacterium]